MKTLYLLRHAKAEPGSKVLGDRDRPLATRGKEACLEIGSYIKAHDYTPGLVIASPSVRTRETSERVLAAARMQPPEQYIDKLYLASADEILHYVRLVKDTLSSVMVVGHNPGMHHASLLFSHPERTDLRRMLELKFPTGSLAVLRFDCETWQDVKQGEAKIADFVTPQSLGG